MRMLETTLLTGPYDWDETLMPRADYDARLAAVREVLRRRDLDGLIVGGVSPEHGAIGYLTGFVPKLGPALAFVPRAGEPRVVFSGGGAMLASAQRLTWIADVRAMRDAGQEAAGWLREVGGAHFGLWGDYAITNAVRGALDRALPAPAVVLDDALDALRRRKTAGEVALIRRAGEIVDVTLAALRAATQSGQGVRTASLAAERAGYAAGAQDVRLLLSMHDGGMPQPVIGPDDPHADPLLAVIAVRFAGYWAEGLATITTKQSAALAAAEAGLAATLGCARPRITAADLQAAAAPALGGLMPHPLCAANNIGNGIGVSRHEAPWLDADHLPLREGDVCTLRAGALAGGSDSAIVSAMVHITAAGAEALAPGR
jgi:Xaa-Pro aminopeptidase